MKTNSLIPLLALLLLSVTTFGQLSNGGEVVDVIDGQTVVVATRNGRVKVELQFINVPEAGHPLHDTVQGHVKRMLIGKVVEFKARIVLTDSVVGRVLLGNVDVSQQLLRDGAARHVPQERSGQTKREFDLYASLEAAARTEKRGVWSVNVPFPTVVEKIPSAPPRPVLAAVANRIGSSPGLGLPDASKNLESWVSSLPLDEEKGEGLRRHTEPSGTYTSISTPLAVLNFTSDSGTQAVECVVIYARPGNQQNRSEPLFALGLRSGSNRADLLNSADPLTIVAERYVVPLAPLTTGSETKYYRISKAFLARIANTRSVELQIDGFKAPLSDEAKEFFKQLLSAAE